MAEPYDVRSVEELIPVDPPLVTAHGVDATDGRPQPVGAALLLWGRHEPSGRWAAGIAFPFQKWRGNALRALLTMWVPAADVRPRPGQSYGTVHRIILSGPVRAWPTLPPIYPGLGREWRAVHLHAHRPDPEGEYTELREAMRDLLRRS